MSEKQQPPKGSPAGVQSVLDSAFDDLEELLDEPSMGNSMFPEEKTAGQGAPDLGFAAPAARQPASDTVDLEDMLEDIDVLEGEEAEEELDVIEMSTDGSEGSSDSDAASAATERAAAAPVAAVVAPAAAPAIVADEDSTVRFAPSVLSAVLDHERAHREAETASTVVAAAEADASRVALDDAAVAAPPSAKAVAPMSTLEPAIDAAAAMEEDEDAEPEITVTSHPVMVTPAPGLVAAAEPTAPRAVSPVPEAEAPVLQPTPSVRAQDISPPSSVPATPAASPPAPAGRPPSGDPRIDDHTAFRNEVQRLARARSWKELAELTSRALAEADWAALPEARASMLIDLARIYRDRLNDRSSAEECFRRLAELDPANADALDFLSTVYRERGQWRALYDLYGAAIEPTWDPEQRLGWTREMVALATDQLKSLDLAIAAWERLWRLGDAVDETHAALSQVYRRGRRWDGLAAFLMQHAGQLKGVERVVALREVAEAYLTGLGDLDRADAVLTEILAERSGDLVALLGKVRILAQRGDWDGLTELGAMPLTGLPEAGVLDFRRAVAEALWQVGELERAVIAYERVLELDPKDADAQRAREQYFERTGKYEALVQLLSERAEAARDLKTQAELLERAADLAEKQLDDPQQAVSLWQRRVALASGPGAGAQGQYRAPAAAYQALARLYDTLGDLAGVGRALEGQLALTRQPAARVELLRRLGEHAAHRMGDDTRAEACWKEIVQLVPGDTAAQQELVQLHRRRGDFEALDRALQQQAWRSASATPSAEELGRLWRAAAENCDQNLSDSRRAVAAWWRVIDLDPEDRDALHALSTHRRTLGQTEELVATLEAELRAAEADQKSALSLEVARLWEEAGKPQAAAAAYERVLCWDPSSTAALAALERLHSGAARGVALSALEVAAAGAPQQQRTPLLRRVVQPQGEGGTGDALERFYGLRRLLWLGGGAPELLAEVEQAAEQAGAWPALAAIYEALAAAVDESEGDPTRRMNHLRALARVAERHLGSPVRALLALESCGRQRITDAALTGEIERLCESTERYEDALALADVAARCGAAPEARRAALLRRLRLCETRLNDGQRAFFEAERLLSLDPNDREALAHAERLGAQFGLWRALDALYAELWDRATDAQARFAIARSRHTVRKTHLQDEAGALDQLLVMARLTSPHEDQALLDSLLAAAESLRAWDRVLPLLEAKVRSAGPQAAPEVLMRVAALHEEKRGDAQRAFELYSEALLLRPAARELQEPLERLAQRTNRWDLLASCYRLAAARSGDTARQLALYHRVTELAADHPELSTAETLDLHRRILQLDPQALPSLGVVIERHRAAGETRELRDRLKQWTEQASAAGHAPATLIPKWLEIAQLSRDTLGDPESALAAYAQVLDVEPEHSEALAGVKSLTAGQMDPALELRRLRLEFVRAESARRVELLLAIARIQEVELDDAAGAIATLRALCEEAGAGSPGHAPLARLYRSQGQWGELIDLLEARAGALDSDARSSALAEAVAVCDERSADAALDQRRERLYRHILTLAPDDAETRRRLLALYRDGQRHADMATLLSEWIGRLSPDQAALRTELVHELARVFDRGLGQLAEAERVLKPLVDKEPADPWALLALASLRLRQDDFAGYLALRQRHARTLSGAPQLASLVLCHLAEACDEKGRQAEVAALYRDARSLDGGNNAAIEALKAIGRRARGWRASAALLPDTDEASLPFSERASRLRQRAEQATTPEDKLGWLFRAVAVEPDDWLAWESLGRVHAARGDNELALGDCSAALDAFLRATAPEPARLTEHAQRIQQLAMAYRAVGNDAQAGHLALRAHELVPDLPSAALAVADQRLESGDQAGALALYDRVLSRAQKLDDSERLHATFRRGAIRAALGEPTQAVADLRQALGIDPLHPGALRALADVLAGRGHVAASIRHYTQALLVMAELSERGGLYARLGRLWEDSFNQHDEAGVCYDLAVAAGVDERDVMVRALRHYRRSGQSGRALEVIDRLLPTTQNAADQALLWTERGGILAQSDEAQAIEAFDMALSYDPGNHAALSGLSGLLERRGDWEQLIQIHEARTELGTPEERAEALRQLARIALGQLSDRERAQRYLLTATELAPEPKDYEQLLELYGDDPAHSEIRQQAIAGLLGLGGPYLARLIELGRLLVAAGQRRWAWALLSPLMSATISDQSLKALVLELRKEFEKHDGSTALHPGLAEELRHPAADAGLLGLLAELLPTLGLGHASAEALGATGLTRLDERTAVGKAFAAIAGRLGESSGQLFRAHEMPVPYGLVVQGQGEAVQVQVIVRADLLQLLSLAESNFLFAFLTELTRPDVRVLSGLDATTRGLLLPALGHALGLMEPAAESGELAAQLRERLGDARGTWAARFTDWLHGAPASDKLSRAAGERLWQGILQTAQRIGTIAANDLRFVGRVLSRLDESLPKMPTVGKLEDVEAFFDNATPIQPLIAFAASAGYGRLIAAAE